MKNVLTTEQELSIRLHALGMAVRNRDGHSAREQVEAAATYFDFVVDGKNPLADARQAVVDEVKAEAAAEAQVEDDPDVTGASDIEDALLSKYTNILGQELHDKITNYVGGHGIMDLLHVGPIGIGEGPFTAEEKNKVLKVLLEVQKDFEDVDLGVKEGDSFCDNCNNIHPKLDFDNPLAVLKTLRESLGKGRMGGIPTFADFLSSLGADLTDDAPNPDTLLRMRDALQERMGEGFEVATHVIKLQPGETPEQAIARHLKEHPIPGMEVGPNGELPPGVVKIDEPTRH